MQSPSGLDRLESISQGYEELLSNWPEYLQTLQEPSLYVAAGGIGFAGLGMVLAGRRAGSYLSHAPGDVVLGRRMDTRLDRFLRSPVVARWIDRTHHLEVTGPTGSGKTTALLPIAVQDLINGHTVAVEEIYGDFGTGLIPYALALGRPVFILDPSLEGSLCLNPLAGENDEDVVGHFASVVEGLFAYHPFYKGFNGDAARAFALLAREYARQQDGEADLALFKLLLSDRAFLYRVLQVRVEGSGYDKTETVGAPWVSRDTRSWFDSDYLRWSDKLRVEYLSALKNWTNKLLAKTAARRVLCPGPNDLALDLRTALSTPGALTVLRFPVEAVDEEPAHAMARFVTKTIQDLTLRRFPDAFGSEVPVPPLSLFLDELPTLVGEDFGDAKTTAQYMALVRKQGVSVTVTHQGGALISDVLSGALDTNARAKLFAPGLGAEDLLRAQRTLGYEEKEIHDERETNASIFSFGPYSRSRGTRTQRAPRFGEDELKYAAIGNWVHQPFRGLQNQPAERIRMRPVPPPEAFARPSWRRPRAA
jgi:RecA/RadA recombinase